MERAILLADMNSFFASVHQALDPGPVSDLDRAAVRAWERAGAPDLRGTPWPPPDIGARGFALALPPHAARKRPRQLGRANWGSTTTLRSGSPVA